MKRSRITIAALLIVCTSVLFVFARDRMHKGEKAGKNACEACCMKKGMCSMHGMMMKCMMDKKMTATQDGGVVVLVAGKLMKYDKDLKMVGEADLKINVNEVQERMKKMMKKCGAVEKCCKGGNKKEKK